MLKVNMIYISSKFLVDEFKYSQNVSEGFMALFYVFLIEKLEKLKKDSKC